MTASTVEADPAALAAALRLPVWNALADRADTIRRALPRRPEGAEERYEWVLSLAPGQARQAALLDRLDALCAHLAGRPMIGCSPADPLPVAALDEADGFTSPEIAELMAAYRRVVPRAHVI
ncbi:hypothetical protein [Streptomyces sp. NPDC088707]|uniref:hypothetical protein n=1 Tax=Streptomyces sp. NPDC088707 TaxID=3365871 RepID=UPI00382EE18F